MISSPVPASAQGIFDFLFGRPPQRQSYPPPPAAPPMERRGYAPEGYDQPYDRGRLEGPRISGGTGRYTSYCVRLCDGKYFPIQRAGSEVCSSLCPASKTKIFSGSDVALAQASDGSRYEDLENAFVYRERTVENCTCNGTDPYGLAKIDIKDDPTARRGDMVATEDGLKKVTDVAPRVAHAEEPRPRPRRSRPPPNPFSFLFR